MAEARTMRLNKVLREFNISLDRAVDFLSSKGHEIEARPTSKISPEIYQLLTDQFQTDKSKKVASKEVGEEKRKEKEALRIQLENEQEERRKKAAAREVIRAKAQLDGPKQVGKIDLNKKPATPKPVKKEAEATPVKETQKVQKPVPENTAPETISNRPERRGIKVAGKIETTPKTVAKPAEPKKPAAATPTPTVEDPATTTPTPTTPAVEAKKDAAEPEVNEVVETQYKKLDGPNFTGQKIDLSKFKKPVRKKGRQCQ